MQLGRPIQRKLGRAMPWEPTHDAHYRLAEILATSRKLPPLYIEQEALRTVETRLHEGDVPLPFGLLVGNHYFCPRLRLEYLLIEGVMPAHIEPTVESITTALINELRVLSTIATNQAKLPIGWYVGGARVLEPLTRQDVALHLTIFPEPWQVFLVRDGFESVRHGAFIRIEQSDSRPYAIRFFELLPDSVSVDNHALPTALHWANYRTPDAVERAESTHVEPPPAPPRESIFRRLSDLRKRIITPRDLRKRLFTPLELPKRLFTPRDQPRRLFTRGSASRAPNGNSSESVSEEPLMPSESLGVDSSERAAPDAPHEVVKAIPVQVEGEAAVAEKIAHTTPPAGSDTRDVRLALGSLQPSAAVQPIAPEPSTIRLPLSGVALDDVGVWVEVRPSAVQLPQRGTQQLAARVLNIRGRPVRDARITYVTSDPSIVSVSPTGLVTSHGPAGPVSISVESGEVRFVVQVMVFQVPQRIEVTPNPTHVTSRRRRRLTPRVFDAVGTVMPAPAITFTSSDPATVAVSSEGVLSTERSQGEVTITVRAEGTALSAAVPVTVLSPTP